MVSEIIVMELGPDSDRVLAVGMGRDGTTDSGPCSVPSLVPVRECCPCTCSRCKFESDKMLFSIDSVNIALTSFGN